MSRQHKEIRYTGANGYEGVLYNWHKDDYTDGEWNYSMSIRNLAGREVLHAYNATPKTIEELARVVNNIGSQVALFNLLNDMKNYAEEVKENGEESE